MNVMPLLLLLLLCHFASSCTYSQRHWCLNTTTWPIDNATLCGVAWRTIMAIDTYRMAIPVNQYWVAASHAYITTRLNQAIAPANTTTADVSVSLMWLGDSLERVCSNLSEWPLDSSAFYALETLRRYNTGNTTCSDEDVVNMTEALYYIHTADMIIIPANLTLATNKTLAYSLLDDEYRYRQFLLSGAVVGCLVAIPVLTIIIILLLDRRRRYYATKKSTKRSSSLQIGGNRGYTAV